MPFQNVETSTTSIASFSTTKTQDYNLCRLENANPAWGASLQITYTFGTASSLVVSLQASNDGVHFADITGSSVTVTSTGTTIYDLGTPMYKIVRVKMVPTGGTVAMSIVVNANNLE